MATGTPLRDLWHRYGHGRKWPVVTLVVVSLVGLALFLAQDPRTLHVRSAYAIGDPRFPPYVAALVNGPLESGNTFTILQNGDAIYSAMLAAIDGARERVAFESYNYNKGVASRAFNRALAAAARRGVTVRVVLDNFGASAPDHELRDELAAAGVQLVWFNPVGIWTVEATNYRTHRKLLIVDGRVAFTGGAGVADHWLGNAQDADHWRDTQFEVRGPGVRALEACFYDNWIEAGGTGAPELSPSPPVRDPGGARRVRGADPAGDRGEVDEDSGAGQDSSVSDGDRRGTAGDSGAAAGTRSVIVWSNPTSGVSNVKLLYLYSIAAAMHAIDIQSPYFVLDSSVRLALVEARRRGVHIRVLTDGPVTDAMSVKHASRHEYEALLEAGDRIFEYAPTMMHAKIMLVDRRWVIVGSANFDNRSLELNDEVAIGADNPDLAERLTAAFEADLTRAHEWRLDEWRARPWHWKARELFWGLFGEVF